MGMIRFILAFSVVASHTLPIFGSNLVGGEIAVNFFFIISGFYTSLILQNKYSNNPNLFIRNRLQKIFPLYWFHLSFVIIYNIYFYFRYASENMIQLFFKVKMFPLIFSLFSNIFIIGQDLFFFFKFNSDFNIKFTNNFRLGEAPYFYNLLFMPQTWFLSIIIMCYFLSPFLQSFSSKKILLITVFVFMIRLCTYWLKLDHDPWTYRFFPTEVLFFLLGILSFRLYMKKIFLTNKTLNIIIFLLTLIYIFIFFKIPDVIIYKFSSKEWLFYISFIFIIPTIFYLTKNLSIDKIIGRITYGIYLNHLFLYIFVKSSLFNFNLYGKFIYLLSIVIFAFFATVFVDKIKYLIAVRFQQLKK